MFISWWIAYIIPTMMVLAGLLGAHIPFITYRSPFGKLDEERQKFADSQLHHMLWQFGLVFVSLVFMVIRTVQIVPLTVQRWLLYGVVLLEVLGVLLMVIPIEKAIRTHFEEDNEEELDEN
ncbi:MAG: hypothetical protein IKV68_06855 [Oscillospiraceae bacterium]|nr:hypothetical protein [Oscillospiraceae bacterium]